MPNPRAGTVLLSADQIQRRVRDLADEIVQRHPTDEVIHLIAVLKGSFMFLADLVRAMRRPVTIDFIAVASYATEAASSGEIQLLKDLDSGIEGRAVVIVEDIVDTGLTLSYLQDMLRARGPKSLQTVCLLSKPSRRRIDVAVDYIGFDVDDRFVVGYCLDYGGRFRHLPHVALLDRPDEGE